MPVFAGRATDGGMAAVVSINNNSGTTGVAPVDQANGSIIDGTPVRVVVLALSAALGLTALRMAGFRFNVGVSAGG